MQNYQVLDWDSEILGVKTAKILPERLVVSELASLLSTLQAQKIQLVFWASAADDVPSQQAAQEFSGFLADQKVTYWVDLANHVMADIDLSEVESYTETVATPELHQLAFEIAAFSRFGTDPRILPEKMRQIYKTWIENSVKRQVAKEVLVIKQHGKVVGMTTLGEKNGRGDIGLLAVDPDCRGMKLGTKLVAASQRWCVQQGYRWGQVVTQLTNPTACKLYEKGGYRVDKVEHFYHFWL